MAEECDYSNNNKDGKNNIDKGKAKNYNNKSYNSSDTDNNDSKNSNSSDNNSSDSNKGNKAHKYIRQQELPVPISSRLKLKYIIKYCL